MIITGKKILITGASGGIGFAIIKALSEYKATIYAHYADNKLELEALQQTSVAQIILIQSDFREKTSTKKLIESVPEKVDIAINAAGIEENPKSDAYDPAGWNEMWQVNLFAVIDITRLIIPRLNKGGVIINISSIMGKHDIAVPIELTGYAVAKAALNKFTLNIAYNHAKVLRAVTISPGYTKTKMWDGFDETVKSECIEDTPIKRFVKPEEIAKSVLAIINNDALTAQDIIVDCGLGVRFIK
jgi:3-oxoacyl-[acyl-carrier protein] reductase